MDTDEYLTASEIALKLKLSTKQVYNLIHRGDLPHIRIGERTVRVRAADLRQYLESNRQTVRVVDTI